MQSRFQLSCWLWEPAQNGPLKAVPHCPEDAAPGSAGNLQVTTLTTDLFGISVLELKLVLH